MLKGYKSPTHKLAVVFKEGSDSWKDKADKRQAELLNLRKSMAYQKNKVVELKEQIKELEAQLSQTASPTKKKRRKR